MMGQARAPLARRLAALAEMYREDPIGHARARAVIVVLQARGALSLDEGTFRSFRAKGLTRRQVEAIVDRLIRVGLATAQVQNAVAVAIWEDGDDR
jgi:hypothetical protein